MNLTVEMIARAYHDGLTHHPGVNYDACTNLFCKRQYEIIAERILAVLKEGKAK
jgi:hypothetical protein